ncbi:hypothetical protein QAD02_000031 [Eretmocerus hayati]|uniref:Uncharacterized protein n=1 Tax=Eretmocerus hayati TaxID=131215 RepID=A0ACC2NET8_9HYME|nr:hypothetical protein QAD02_000031 [Eretmocerus hayati]
MNGVQISVLISFMVDHNEYGLGHKTNLGPCGKITSRELGEKLLREVNRAGPPIMTSEQLKAAWTTKKNDAKEKLAAHKKEKAKTGNTRMTALLTEQEETVCKLFKNFALDIFINECFGFGNVSQLCVDERDPDHTDLPTSPIYCTGPLIG